MRVDVVNSMTIEILFEIGSGEPYPAPIIKPRRQVSFPAVNKHKLRIPFAFVPMPELLTVQPNRTVFEPGLRSFALQRFGPRPYPGQGIAVKFDPDVVIEEGVKRIESQFFADDLCVTFRKSGIAHRDPLQGCFVEVFEETFVGQLLFAVQAASSLAKTDAFVTYYVFQFSFGAVDVSPFDFVGLEIT